MMGRTHALTGLAAGLGAAVLTGQVGATPVAAYLIAAGAALLPDLDQPRSMAGRAAVTRPIQAALALSRRFGNRGARHRRFTHSLVGWGLFGLAAFGVVGLLTSLGVAVSPAFPLAAVIGYGSHLAADACNKQGIQLFWPLEPFGITWWSIPLPKPLRISTVTESGGIPLTPGQIQARIHTEKWFFRWPVQALIVYLIWHHAERLLAITRADTAQVIQALPQPLAAWFSALAL